MAAGAPVIRTPFVVAQQVSPWPPESDLAPRQLINVKYSAGVLKWLQKEYQNGYNAVLASLGVPRWPPCCIGFNESSKMAAVLQWLQWEFKDGRPMEVYASIFFQSYLRLQTSDLDPGGVDLQQGT